MARPSPRKTGPVVQLARTILAAVLACVVLAGAAPPGSASDAPGCPMPCCKSAGGGCADGSCHAEIPLKIEPAHGADSDAAHAHHAGANHDARQDAPYDHTAPPAQHAPPARDEVNVEHNHRRHVSGRDTRPGAPGFKAAVSKPCPPDCGAAPNAFNTQPRPREQAALHAAIRTRRQTQGRCARPPAFVFKSSTARRGPSPTRGPPSDASVPTA